MKAFWRGQVGKEHEAEFELLENIQLPEHCQADKEDSQLSSMFRKGGTFRGYPAVIEMVLFDGNGKRVSHKPDE